VLPGGSVMDDAKFDRLARAFAKNVSRRLTVALIGAATGMFGQQAARGFQLGPATCGEQGAVCTLVSGCCDGLTCVTSAINTSYGVCVPGEGAMLSTGTTLISPFSETVVEEVSALMSTASTAPATDATDLQAEREARIAEIRARKETRRTERRTRLDTKRATVRTRKDEQPNRQRDAREAKEPKKDARGPRLEFNLLNPGGVTGIETVRIRNRDDGSVHLAKIESVLHPEVNSATNRTVPPGGLFSYYSGISEDISDRDEQAWTDKPICSGSAGAGFMVTVGIHANSVFKQHVVLCNRPPRVKVNGPRAATPRRKRKRSDQQQKKKR
jgi:hypothetical protein